jgi:hypothetical protein
MAVLAIALVLLAVVLLGVQVFPFQGRHWLVPLLAPEDQQVGPMVFCKSE